MGTAEQNHDLARKCVDRYVDGGSAQVMLYGYIASAESTAAELLKARERIAELELDAVEANDLHEYIRGLLECSQSDSAAEAIVGMRGRIAELERDVDFWRDSLEAAKRNGATLSERIAELEQENAELRSATAKTHTYCTYCVTPGGCSGELEQFGGFAVCLGHLDHHVACIMRRATAVTADLRAQAIAGEDVGDLPSMVIGSSTEKR